MSQISLMSQVSHMTRIVWTTSSRWSGKSRLPDLTGWLVSGDEWANATKKQQATKWELR